MQSNSITTEIVPPQRDFNYLRWNFKDNPDYSQYDIIIFTDGASHTELMGGFGAVIMSTKYPALAYKKAYGCSNNTNTGRAELFAIVHALHTALNTLREEGGFDLETIKEMCPSILVLSDRWDVVGKAAHEFKRGVDKDLWLAYDYYTDYFDVMVRHIPRDTMPTHKIVDAIASELRIVLIDFSESQTDAKHI